MTNQPTPSHDLDRELGDLWLQRENLDAAGWSRLYEIVREILSSYWHQEFADLEEDREIYVQEFFQDKVFVLDAQPARVHAGALKHFYRNYLRDQRRRSAVVKRHIVPTQRTDEDEDPEPEGVSPCTEADDFSMMRESGLDPAAVASAARTWLDAAEDWVPVYLAFHFCPDREHSEALRTLAQRLSIRSYHYKAERLGINWRSRPDDDRRFSDTMIGAWVEQNLGLSVTAENLEALHGVFKLLCLEALLWAERQESAQ